ncbi:hypothetical protein VE03_05894 [Pseudogymnoascus sp. 23342-1-I1]|nr:hypothetical protein VE03_05894 [Pseudogymnoascus sp. 23342-1-I1]
MEAEQSATLELNLFHKDNIRSKTLDDIRSSMSKLHDTMQTRFRKFEDRQTSRDFLWDPRRDVGKLTDYSKAEASKAEELLLRLHSEMVAIFGIMEGAATDRLEVTCSWGMLGDMSDYAMTWVKTLWMINKIFQSFVAKGELVEKYRKRMERLTLSEEMTEGTEDGTDLFHGVLAERLEKFGMEEIEDALDEFLSSKEFEKEEAESEQKEWEESQALEIARQGFQEVFDGMKKELDELKGEMAELKTARGTE